MTAEAVRRACFSLILAVLRFSSPDVAVAGPASRTVAITFDDLPFADPRDGTQMVYVARALDSSKRIQRALRRHSAPAIGFVNEVKVERLGRTGTEILKSWNSGPFELGNHGFAHADSNSLTIPEIEQEIERGETTIKPLAESAGRSLRFYRFAFNHVGDTEQRRAQIEELLKRRGYRLAASTIDTSDYIFAKAYDRALSRKETAMQTKIKAAYLDFTRQQIEYYAALDAKVLGHEPPEIMLLHLSSLNVATTEAILRIFEKRGYKFVSLDVAQSDQAYRSTPAVATKFGPMWGVSLGTRAGPEDRWKPGSGTPSVGVDLRRREIGTWLRPTPSQPTRPSIVPAA